LAWKEANTEKSMISEEEKRRRITIMNPFRVN